MWRTIVLWSLASLLICGAAAVMLRLQPIGARPNFINRFAGLSLNHGFRLTRRWRLTGDRQLISATLTAWLIWAVLGGAVIALVRPGYDPAGMWIAYGILCGLGGLILGGALGIAAGTAYAKAVNMSSFEGKAGYFVVLIGLLGGVLGALVCGIGMALYFRQQGQ